MRICHPIDQPFEIDGFIPKFCPILTILILNGWKTIYGDLREQYHYCVDVDSCPKMTSCHSCNEDEILKTLIFMDWGSLRCFETSREISKSIEEVRIDDYR